MTEEERKALSSLRSICSKTEKSEFDAKQYLEKKEIFNDEIIEILKEDNYINNERYTECFINDKIKFNKWGKIKIYHILKQKGIAVSIINKKWELIDEELYLSNLKKIIKDKYKSIKNKNLTKIVIRQKIINFCQSRGYEFELINKELK